MHNIEYFSYEENIKRDWVQQKLDHYVAQEDWQEGCKGLARPIRWLEDGGICEDMDAAEAFITAHDRGNYDQLAVRYYLHIEPKDSKALQALKDRHFRAFQRWKDMLAELWASGLKADYVGCRACGSKLKREYIKSNFCPVCHCDLRPNTMLATIKKAKDAAGKADKTVAEYIKKHGTKKVSWLVKIEYHT